MLRLSAALLCLALPVAAQESVNTGTGAQLRGLDKLNAKVTDFRLPNNGVAQFGVIEVELSECRYPSGNPSGDAYAFLTIREAGVREPIFRGWMVASSPALNPLDHARYDVWVLRCTTS